MEEMSMSFWCGVVGRKVMSLAACLEIRPGQATREHSPHNSLSHTLFASRMVHPPNKRQKRKEYREAFQIEGFSELPKKKFYRQRAHANPFSDHQLI
jgi:hypothetical protein